MASPKSGTAGTIVAPTAPTAAKDSVTAKAGSSTTPSNSGSTSGGAGSSTDVGAYTPPTSSGPPPPQHKPADHPEKTSWIALQLVYESNGKPVAGMNYEVTLPDGKTISTGSTDENGKARVDNIDPGSCKISFPSLDKEAWQDA